MRLNRNQYGQFIVPLIELQHKTSLHAKREVHRSIVAVIQVQVKPRQFSSDLAFSIAYISLQHETTHVGALRWVLPPKREQCALLIPTCWYLKSLATKHKSPQAQLETPLTQREPPPTQREPNMSRWNIGHIGSPSIMARVGHVYFMLLVSISFALGSQFRFPLEYRLIGFGEISFRFLKCLSPRNKPLSLAAAIVKGQTHREYRRKLSSE